MKYIFVLILCFNFLYSDEIQNSSEIVWPMKTRLPISGTFAEFRNSHLHMGCDFKTYGINGFPILSIFDGNISSMSYSEKGYGLSINLYSQKFNLTAKYAHLNDLNSEIPELENFKLALQLLNGTEGFAVKLPNNKFITKKFQKIARSGETGSGVSHLHLEIFDSNQYYNPLSFKEYNQKDTNPPTMLSIFIDSDNGYSKKINLKTMSSGIFQFSEMEKISLSGKVKLKIAGFDRISSKNQNNIWGLKLKVNDEVVYNKNFSKMNFKQASEKDEIYDINKSSLSPPFYVYNLFSKADGYSLDLKSFEENKPIKIQIEMIDASNNISTLQFSIHKGNETITSNKNIDKKFKSNDEKLKLDFSKSSIIGEGTVSVEKVSSLPENAKIQNLKLVSDIYQITANDYSWKGNVEGIWEGKFESKNQSLYLFDSVLSRWTLISIIKNSSPIKFNFSRLGIIAILEDNSPPEIHYPYLIYRDYNLPELQASNMIERFYAVTDKGSGVSSSFEVILEGEPYPYIFDRDRHFVKLEIPKNLNSKKGFLFIQIRTHDYAGNYSDWFSDIVRLK